MGGSGRAENRFEQGFLGEVWGGQCSQSFIGWEGKEGGLHTFFFMSLAGSVP